MALMLSVMAASTANAQNAANNWIFGNHARINFGGSPNFTPVTSSALFPAAPAFNTDEGCSSISDSNGDLLFYTDGTQVWNKNHVVMPNGSGLMGHTSSTQSALIVPCSCNKYFIFTTDAHYHQYMNGLRYSVVDMNAPGTGGLGDVMAGSKNISLLPNTAEKVAGVSDGTGGFWVVTHTMGDNRFFSYHIVADSDCTLNPQNAVISAVGTPYVGGWSGFGQGQMKFSPDGKYLAHAGLSIAAVPASFVEIFNFNMNTGVVSSAGTTFSDTSVHRFYGLEFSPNSQALYATTTQSSGDLYRYNIIATGLDIANRTITNIGGVLGGAGALQLAPDGKIYIACIGKTKLFVLPAPNSPTGGWLSTISPTNLFSLAPGTSSQYGLPAVLAGNFSCGSVASKWCCPGANLVKNGDFELGNTAFSSGHIANPSTALFATAPGQYNVVNSAGALAISPNWNVTDHAVCNGLTGSNFMVVNGKTTQPIGSSRVVWQQTVNVTKDKEYRFCANVKNLIQSTFDLKPLIWVQFINPNNSIAAVTVNEAAGPCNWKLLSTTFSVPTTGGMTIKIWIDEARAGDGNDLALDDISLQEITTLPEANVLWSYAMVPLGGGQFNVEATYPANTLAAPCQYAWMVGELTGTLPNLNWTWSTLAINPPSWQTFPGSTVNWFNGYNGTSTVTPGTNHGIFLAGKSYRIVFAAKCDCNKWTSFGYDFTPQSVPPALKTPGGGTYKVTRAKLSERDLMQIREWLNTRAFGPLRPKPEQADDEKPIVIPVAPGADEAAELPKAEDDASVEIAVAKPSVTEGDMAPDFKVEDANGKTWRLSDLRKKKNVLLTFFPKCFTGGCANHLSSLRDRQREFDAADTQIIAVSVDPAAGERGQLAFAKQWQLKFPLIPDTQRSLSKLYGAVRNDNQRAARMTILIDKQGVVQFVDTNVQVQTHGDDMLAVMRRTGMIR